MKKSSNRTIFVLLLLLSLICNFVQTPLPRAQDKFVLAPVSELVSEVDIRISLALGALGGLEALGEDDYEAAASVASKLGLVEAGLDGDSLYEETRGELTIGAFRLIMKFGTHDEKLEALSLLEGRGDEALSFIHTVIKFIAIDPSIRKEALDTCAKIAQRSEKVVPEMLKYVGIHSMEMIIKGSIPANIKIKIKNKSGLPKIGALPIKRTNLDFRFAAALVLIKIGTPEAINPLKENMARLNFPADIKEELLKKIAEAESEEEDEEVDFVVAGNLTNFLEFLNFGDEIEDDI